MVKMLSYAAPAIELMLFLQYIQTPFAHMVMLTALGLVFSCGAIWKNVREPVKSSRKRAASKRRERMKANGGSHTAAEWLAMCEAAGYRCAACNEIAPLTKDHIVAVAQGGSDDISNIQQLCRSCNSSKNNRTIDYRKAYRR